MTLLFLLFAARGDIVTCEHYLWNSPSLQNAVEAQVLDRLFTMNGREDGVLPKAYTKLKLSPRMTDKSWHNVVFSLHRPKPRTPELLMLQVGRFTQGEIVWATQVGLHDDTPVLWRTMKLSQQELEMPYAELVQRYPVGALAANAFESEFLGYSTDPDVNGVRIYVAARSYPDDDNITIDLGIDVPCEDFAKYAVSRDRPRLVRAATTYCRVSMMSFSADELRGDERL